MGLFRHAAHCTMPQRQLPLHAGIPLPPPPSWRWMGSFSFLLALHFHHPRAGMDSPFPLPAGTPLPRPLPMDTPVAMATPSGHLSRPCPSSSGKWRIRAVQTCTSRSQAFHQAPAVRQSPCSCACHEALAGQAVSRQVGQHPGRLRQAVSLPLPCPSPCLCPCLCLALPP